MGKPTPSHVERQGMATIRSIQCEVYEEWADRSEKSLTRERLSGFVTATNADLRLNTILESIRPEAADYPAVLEAWEEFVWRVAIARRATERQAGREAEREQPRARRRAMERERRRDEWAPWTEWPSPEHITPAIAAGPTSWDAVRDELQVRQRERRDGEGGQDGHADPDHPPAQAAQDESSVQVMSAASLLALAPPSWAAGGFENDALFGPVPYSPSGGARFVFDEPPPFLEREREGREASPPDAASRAWLDEYAARFPRASAGGSVLGRRPREEDELTPTLRRVRRRISQFSTRDRERDSEMESLHESVRERMRESRERVRALRELRERNRARQERRELEQERRELEEERDTRRDGVVFPDGFGGLFAESEDEHALSDLEAIMRTRGLHARRHRVDSYRHLPQPTLSEAARRHSFPPIPGEALATRSD